MIKYLSTDKNTQDGDIINWFDVDGEQYGLCNREELLDCDGFPVGPGNRQVQVIFVIEEFLNRLVTVCSSCKAAQCWHGELLCIDCEDAGTVDMKRSDLVQLGAEHHSHFSDEKLLEVTGE